MQRNLSPIAPLHTGTLAGNPVRFFRSPSSRPDLPWHAVEDLQKALNLPREVRRHMLRMTQASWPGVLRTVATDTGLTTIAPHFVAQGVIGGAVEMGVASADSESEYAMAGGEALKALLGDLPFEATLAYAAEAIRAESAGEPV